MKILGINITRPVYVVSSLGQNKLIIGIDMITEMQMTIQGNRTMLPPHLNKGLFSLHAAERFVVPPRTVLHKKLFVQEVCEKIKPGKNVVISTIFKAPFAWEGVQTVQPDGSVLAVFANMTDRNILIRPHRPAARAHPLDDDDPQPASDDQVVAAVSSHMGAIKDDPPKPSSAPAPKLEPEARDNFLSTLQLKCPEDFIPSYQKLCLDFHDVFSKSKFDLGHTDVIQHSIRLKDHEPVHVKQFPLPHEHRQIVLDWVDELLAQGAIELSRSAYNSPIFLVPKPHGGGMRAVLDFRKLNTASLQDRYVIREIRECIDEVGAAGSCVFSAADLTSGFWQQTLEEESRQYTAFTVPGGARFQWTVTPMGLQGSPASFARLIDHVVRGLPGIIAYIDDVLGHAKTHPDMISCLSALFMRFRQFGLKMNAKKSIFGASSIQYLGYTLSALGVGAGLEKLRAIREYKEPETIKSVRIFLGLTNYFRFLVPNFARHACQLSKLLQKERKYKKGKMPPESVAAFEYLRRALTLNPVVRHPSKKGEWHLTTDAAQGDKDCPGGMGAVLSQMVNLEERIIGYISRGLKPFEKNYSAYLLELAAAEWAIDYFYVYLFGRRFILHTDHLPLTSLGTVHKRTLNRLQQQLLEHNFEIRYKKGGDNVIADALSRNPVDVLTDSSGDLATAQAADHFCQDLRKFLDTGELPEHSQGYLNKIKRLGPDCKVENNILYFWHKREHFRTVWCAIVPEALRNMITEAAHNTWHGGHGGVHRTVNRICQSYYWPGMHKYVQDYIARCPRCQVKDNKKPPASPLHSLPICEGPNERVHIDLFGPMKSISPAGNKYVCVMTDAYTKIVELAPIADKSAETVAKTIFERWICRYSCMIQVITDNGLEFCNQVLDTLCDLLGIKHKRTSSYHPASNSSAESFNRSMRKYLIAMLDNDATLNWEPQLPMLQLSYNCHIHQTTHESPFWLTYHFDPRLPYFDLDKPKPLYSQEFAPATFKAFSETHKRVHKEQWEARKIREDYYNKKTKERDFQVGERVLFYVTAIPRNVNPKFFKHWQGPYTITEKFSPLNYQIKLSPRSKPILVHVEKIKHFQEEERQKKFDSKPPQQFINDRAEELEGEEVTPAECVKHAQECNQNGFIFRSEDSNEDLNKEATSLQRQLDEQEIDKSAPALASQAGGRRITRAAAKLNGDRLLSPLRNSRI